MARALTSEADGQAGPGHALTHSSLYRAVWRWHFYAGLLVLPLLIWLVVTGALYIYHDAIDQRVHADLLTVPLPAAPAVEPAPHSVVLAAALAAQQGAWFKYTPAAAPGQSAEVGVRTADGAKVAVYLNPANAQVLGTLSDRGTLGWTIRKLHSLKYFGPVQRGFIEMAAGWAILLVLTGLYLWWPRGRGAVAKGGVVSVRGTPRQRVYWRDLHAVTGLVVGVGLLFLAFTGMPWSVLWGAQANAWANGHNFGYPAGVRVQLPMSGQPLADAAHLPWTLQYTQQPGGAGHEDHQSHQAHPQTNAEAEDNPHALHGEGAAAQPAPSTSGSVRAALDIDSVMAQVQRLQLAPGYTVNPPQGAQGVFTASVYPHDLARQRVVHLDQFTGQPLLDMSYADYGPLGRWLEWGINIHLGQEWGVANQLLLVAVCAGIVLLCVSGAVMWFKRRPAGGLGVPPLPVQRRALVGVVVVLAVGGVVFPLVGVSMVVLVAVDACVVNWGRRV
ncbi:PepSY domain-containing protein [Acidovorax sp. 1608163]|uniref:PepSY-associated TM helix domain-containing protein n=1 Tax=Acidovorax sp. 1608163 TaxID=2478662 RepID=UPI000EF701B5|nr:PepSY domain-containing protein [Acidovorax sp. 1608163]AYM95172.1 PepSY domain-containing protein [Acidovorax sp. 1608163]